MDKICSSYRPLEHTLKEKCVKLIGQMEKECKVYGHLHPKQTEIQQRWDTLETPKGKVSFRAMTMIGTPMS